MAVIHLFTPGKSFTLAASPRKKIEKKKRENGMARPLGGSVMNHQKKKKGGGVIVVVVVVRGCERDGCQERQVWASPAGGGGDLPAPTRHDQGPNTA